MAKSLLDEEKFVQRIAAAVRLQLDLDNSLPKRRERTYTKGAHVDDAQDRKLRFAISVVKAFEAKGFTNCVANETILTRNRWAEMKGRRVKESELGKAVLVNGLRLWHISQTESVAAAKPVAVASGVKLSKEQLVAEANKLLKLAELAGSVS